MTIAPFAAGSYVTSRSTANLLNLKSELGTLTGQLSSGRASETYGGLGSGRITSLNAHATISTLDGYVAAAGFAKTRVDLATTSLSQIKTVTDTTRTRLLTTLQTTTPVGISNSVSLARTNFDAAVDALNQQAAGQYIFSGRSTDTQPVLSSRTIFDGDPSSGLVGLKALIAEQTKADLGPSATGRLSSSLPAGSAVVTLSEDPSVEARANFGFHLVSVSTSNSSGVATTDPVATAQGGTASFATQPADGAKVRVAVLLADGSQRVVDLSARSGTSQSTENSFAIGADAAATAGNLKTTLDGMFSPAAKIASIQSANPPGASLDFSAVAGAGSALSLEVKAPVAGDTVSIKLGMRDGTTTVVTLTASADTTNAGSFKIDTTGATPADRAANTAANLNQALELALKTTAGTELAASSAQRAAENFFDGSSSPGLAPRRVSGDGYAETASNNTVIWYRGDDTASDPRSTATVQVGVGQTVGIGAQANEKPIRATLAGLAALAAGSFTDASGTQDVGKFAAAAARTVDALAVKPDGTSVADLVTAFGLASSSMANAKTQAQTTKQFVQESIDGIENVSIEEVAAKLLTLQTQLQASYQVTSMISKLTLANFLN